MSAKVIERIVTGTGDILFSSKRDIVGELLITYDSPELTVILG